MLVLGDLCSVRLLGGGVIAEKYIFIKSETPALTVELKMQMFDM